MATSSNVIESSKSRTWKELQFQPLSAIADPEVSNAPKVKLPSLVGTKYETEISLGETYYESHHVKVQEVVVNSHRSKFGYLLDLICQNIMPSSAETQGDDVAPNDVSDDCTSLRDVPDDSGVVLVIDCGYKWIDSSLYGHRRGKAVFEGDSYLSNSLYLKLLVNMNPFPSVSLESKKEHMRKLILVNGLEKDYKSDGTQRSPSTEFSIDSLLYNLKKVIYKFDRLVSVELSDFAYPLKCIVVENTDLFYWEMRDKTQLNSKTKEMRHLLSHMSETLQCPIFITRLQRSSE